MPESIRPAPKTSGSLSLLSPCVRHLVRRTGRILAPALLALAAVLPAAQAPAAPSSFIGMGVATGTPTGDVAAAITPVLSSMETPESVRKAVFSERDLVPVPVSAEFPRRMRIGLQASLALTTKTRWLRYTVEELRHVLGDANVELLWLDDRSLKLGAKSRQLDFILADADTFALAQTSAPYEALASFRPNQARRAEDAQAGVLFTRRTRTLTGLAALGSPDVTIGALNSETLAAWRALLAHLQLMGLSGASLLERTTFYGFSPESVVHGVLSGAQTVGALPACILEEMEERGKISIARDLSILSPQTGDTLACQHTTATYPGWTFGASQSLDPAWKKAVSTILYSMSAPEYGGEWALPAVNRMVFDMFYELKIGPYEHLATWSLNRFLRENSEFLAIALLVAFVILAFMVSLSVLVRIKTRELKRALEERDVIEAEAAQSRAHIANLERTGIVGQMSTIIAHELKQPLAAIANFANSLNRRTKKGNFDEKAFGFALGEIIAQADRANEIVNRVRAYAKHDYPPRKAADLHEIVGNAITTFHRSRQTKADLLVRVPRGSIAEVDAWEIELAVLNLMKNAADATSGVDAPRIEVSLGRGDDHMWVLSVADNGPWIDDERFDALFKPLQTTKGSGGMGLGLSIVSSIAERHAGHVEVERNGANGLRFSIFIPRARDPQGGADEGPTPAELQIYAGDSAKPQPVQSAQAAARASLDPAETQLHGL